MSNLSSYGLASSEEFSLPSFRISLSDGPFSDVSLDEIPHVVNVLSRFGFDCVVSSNSKNV